MRLRALVATLAAVALAGLAPLALASPAQAGDDRITVTGTPTCDTLSGRWVATWAAHNHTDVTATIQEHAGHEWSAWTIAPGGESHYRSSNSGSEKIAYGGVTVTWPGSSTEVSYTTKVVLNGTCRVDTSRAPKPICDDDPGVGVDLDAVDRMSIESYGPACPGASVSGLWATYTIEHRDGKRTGHLYDSEVVSLDNAHPQVDVTRNRPAGCHVGSYLAAGGRVYDPIDIDHDPYGDAKRSWSVVDDDGCSDVPFVHATFASQCNGEVTVTVPAAADATEPEPYRLETADQSYTKDFTVQPGGTATFTVPATPAKGFSIGSTLDKHQSLDWGYSWAEPLSCQAPQQGTLKSSATCTTSTVVVTNTGTVPLAAWTTRPGGRKVTKSTVAPGATKTITAKTGLAVQVVDTTERVGLKDCGSATPTPSASVGSGSSASPGASATVDPSSTPVAGGAGDLPVTGSRLGLLGAMAGGLLLGGGVLILLARRRSRG
ncbi:hypothetical protein [Actinocatenispora thailandica]|nr:hypothetical protein [Actinocatenispora thailandica]